MILASIIGERTWIRNLRTVKQNLRGRGWLKVKRRSVKEGECGLLQTDPYEALIYGIGETKYINGINIERKKLNF